MLLFFFYFLKLILYNGSRNSKSFLLFTLLLISLNFFFCLRTVSSAAPVLHIFTQTIYHLGKALRFAPGKACNFGTRQGRKSREKKNIKRKRERKRERKSIKMNEVNAQMSTERKRRKRSNLGCSWDHTTIVNQNRFFPFSFISSSSLPM